MARRRVGSRFVALLAMTTCVGGFAPALAGRPAAATTGVVISLTPKSGPPGSTVTVSGSNFGANEAVDVYFDTTDEALASTSDIGGFTATITVPKSATPGAHWITGVGRHSGLSAQAQFSVHTNWPEFRNGPLHRGHNTTENVLNTATVPGLDLDWSVTTAGQFAASAAVVNGMVYIGSDKMYAFNATTGTTKWSYSLVGDGTISSPAVNQGTVYFGTDLGKVYALNAATGALKWSYLTGSAVYSSPAVVNGVVYVGSLDDKVYALNASTGALIWSYSTTSSVDSSPAVANGTVYVGSFDHKVYALNAATGTLEWSYTTGGVVYPSSPAVAGGVVYVGSGDDKLYALNATTGALIWAYTTGSGVNTSPAVANGVIYFGSGDDKIYALNALTGALNWSYNTGSAVDSSPVVANGVVYVGSGNHRLYAINASNGAVLWSYITGNAIPAPATVADGTVYVGSDDDRFYAFDLAGGSAGAPRPHLSALRPNRHLRRTA